MKTWVDDGSQSNYRCRSRGVGPRVLNDSKYALQEIREEFITGDSEGDILSTVSNRRPEKLCSTRKGRGKNYSFAYFSKKKKFAFSYLKNVEICVPRIKRENISPRIFEITRGNGEGNRDRAFNFFSFPSSKLENIFSSGYFAAGLIKCMNRGENNVAILQLEEKGRSVGKKEENSFFSNVSRAETYRSRFIRARWIYDEMRLETIY